MRRFCELIFGSNEISPTKLEYAMYAAKGAALRSASSRSGDLYVTWREIKPRLQ
jgi:hypothetical protein